MKPVLRCVWILLLSSSGGCSFLEYSVRNLYAAPVDKIDEWEFCCRLHKLARVTWTNIEKAEGKHTSDAYAAGFEAGFVDYIDRNGDGNPPAMAPYCYQRAALRDLSKLHDIEDWFNGFRHGSRVAQATGLREKVVVPISLPPQPETVPQYLDPPTQNQPTEQLPPPTKLQDTRLQPMPMPNQKAAAPPPLTLGNGAETGSPPALPSPGPPPPLSLPPPALSQYGDTATRTGLNGFEWRSSYRVAPTPQGN